MEKNNIIKLPHQDNGYLLPHWEVLMPMVCSLSLLPTTDPDPYFLRCS